ncbi:MAG: hypothetical protein WAM66_03075 [Acidobacteriaceae bacterium]
MATQIFEREHAVLLPRPSDATLSADGIGDGEPLEPAGGALRGFVFAMLFNVLLVLVGVGGWQLWRMLR